jgi:polyribonucleotide nucleotidyltransferase
MMIVYILALVLGIVFIQGLLIFYLFYHYFKYVRPWEAEEKDFMALIFKRLNEAIGSIQQQQGRTEKKSEAAIERFVKKQEKKLNMVSEKLLESYQKQLKSDLESLRENIAVVVRRFESDLGSQVAKSRQEWQEEMRKKSLVWQKKLEKEKEKQVAAWKKKLARKANAILKQALGRSLTPRDEEELIFKALEEARRELNTFDV